MADQLDNRPVFTIVMGCNGAGKSAWKRANRDRLPERYYDKDSIADGVGGWDTGRAREHTDAIVNQAVDEALAGRHNFGIESTYSGQPGRALVERAVDAGYRIEGVYIGTSSPDVNIERIRHRVDHQTGHYVDPQRVPDRYRHSLHNLRQTADRFDELVIVDNSPSQERGIPDPRTELVLERGRVAYAIPDPAPWVATWKERFDMSMESRERTAAKAARGAAQARRPGVQALEKSTEFESWWRRLGEKERGAVGAAVERLQENGGRPGHPGLSEVKSSRHGNLRELRVQNGDQAIRVFCAVDPARRPDGTFSIRRTAIVLLGGRTRGQEKNSYREDVRRAEVSYEEHLRQVQRGQSPERGQGPER